jgi:predicted metal-dependent hydrolase
MGVRNVFGAPPTGDVQPRLPFICSTDQGVVDRSVHSALAPPPASFSDTTFVFVRHPRARRYVIRVREDGTIRVTIPRRGTKREAHAFANDSRGWIEKELVRAAAARLRLRDRTPPEVVRALKARAGHELPARLLAMAAEHGVTVARISVRDQRWRWGSCSRSGHICLNWRLVGMPDWVRDYVLIHELMHLKRMDHSPKFWKLVGEACPEYRVARSWLRRNQSLLRTDA